MSPELQTTRPFSAIETISGSPDAGILFLCDHASNTIPEGYGTLGLPSSQLVRHIAWDIGAADVTRALAAHFQAPAVLTRYSRLLIDPNRGPDDPTLVMRISDGAIIPGNVGADAAEIERRKSTYWQPYRDAAASVLDAKLSHGTVPAIVSIHSFTDIWRGRKRPWEIGLLWDSDPRLASGLLQELRRDHTLHVGDNEPYDGALIGDTMYEHGTLRGLPHVLIELRQDLIATDIQAKIWAERLAEPLTKALARDDIRRVQHYTSRAGSGKRYRLPDQ